MAQPIDFVKVPVSLTHAGMKDIRLYCAFLDFKAFNPEGFIRKISKRKNDRYFYRYWKENLIKKGWAIERRNGFTLVSYQQVWKEIGVLPTWNKRERRFKLSYRRIQIDELPAERKEYFPFLQNIIQNQITGNVKRRIKWRLRNKQKQESETFLSCRRVARLFHLQSPSSGHKYREKLFDVIPEPTERVPTEYGYRYKCKRVAL
jgi:hypothetical protein